MPKKGKKHNFENGVIVMRTSLPERSAAIKLLINQTWNSSHL
jgi:hypothetical protein